MRLHELCHVMDGMLTRIVRREDRTIVLEYVRSGYDGDGNFVGRTKDQDVAIRCVDCPRQQCEDCPTRKVDCVDNETR